ncbi:hypothetical protein N825_26985 [Skermanella stibiiresistens SB22]|uniref:Uncharacterized protein n=1 Tax=Skermanella stibiiresistens SB22 TaxID=1385369 RepID=W9GRK7_9PROT|nr:hypothetical protein [Skermanella stibiiresistens]EWY36394.1 hypothetical protein N825_26985 [Skermanella stibiiresistens SB22]
MIQINFRSRMFPRWDYAPGMAQEHPSLADQLNGVILLAEVSWHSPSGEYANAARVFRLVGRMHGVAAVARRVGYDVDLRIIHEDLLG